MVCLNLGLSSTNFTWSIIEYFGLNNPEIKIMQYSIRLFLSSSSITIKTSSEPVKLETNNSYSGRQQD